ncbi:excitatory amino acid transporter 3-like [Cyclopterus lumpus]|uniref:excitatory amino acid transporter 3-like n=1 Tax=Cyclopterus lumpus TaxID=8103 RepID=UPI0014868B86|nr:excitatory amino acid transporter 3-like [Cyclopterus lumpus]
MKMENVTEEENTRGCFGCVKRCRDYIVRSAFLDRNLAAVALGIVLGLIIKFSVTLSEQGKFYINLPGEFIIHALHVVTTPFLITSVTTGLILALSIEPGVDAMRKEDTEDTEDKKIFSIGDVLLNLVLNIIPENPVLDLIRQYKIERFEFNIEADEQHLTLEQNATQVRIVRHYVEGTNLLGLMSCSYLIGLGIIRMGEREGVLLELYTVFDEAAQCVVHWILGFLPFGMVFMVIGIVVEADDWEIAIKLGKFMGVVVFGLIIHGSLVLPLIYFLFARCNPYAVIKEVFPALKTALIVSSRSATLPLTFQCCEERLKIDKRISRLILPIWTNIKMDGTVLYEVVAVVFVAQINHIDLDLNKLIIIADRCNTVINVMGDCIGLALIQELSKGDLEDIEEQEQEMERMHGSDA